MSRCQVVGCIKPTRSKGLCGGHYQRRRTHGDVLADVPFQVRHERATQESPKIVTRICRVHGMTEFALQRQGNWQYICKKCRSERACRRRRDTKSRLIQEHGGKCVRCGYARSYRALHFHHRDPALKEFGIGSKIMRSYEAARREAQKCILVCANCHAELEDKIYESYIEVQQQDQP